MNHLTEKEVVYSLPWRCSAAAVATIISHHYGNILLQLWLLCMWYHCLILLVLPVTSARGDFLLEQQFLEISLEDLENKSEMSQQN